MNNIVTRFAPSPTGHLHIGSARTALFNYLYARACGGKFLLRIDDTDFARSKSEYTDSVLSSLEFLGINWDNKGNEMHQSRRMDLYKKLAHELLDKGLAYRCYVPADDANLGMIDDPMEKRKYLRNFAEREAFSVRFKMPDTGSFVVHDTVNGATEIKYESLDDFTLLRQDGNATYMFSSVVDDEELRITNIIRGVEHLPNTYRQVPLIMAMGYSIPVYSHIPLINNAQGQKLSKRLDATSVQEYAELGILPEALCNYVLRLGWGHGDVDIITMDEVIKIFSLNGFRPSPARFDMDKLISLNRHYMRTLPDVTKRMFAGQNLSDRMAKQLEICAHNLLEKVDTIREAEDIFMKIFASDELKHREPAPEVSYEIRQRLEEFDFNAVDYSSIEATKKSVLALAPEKPLNREFMMFLRVALTGMTVSPGLFEIINALGADVCNMRLRSLLLSEQ